MGNRIHERYLVSDFLKERNFRNRMCVEIRLDQLSFKAQVKDVSVEGLGFELQSPQDEQVRGIAEARTFFAKLVAGDEEILVEARKAWSASVKKDGADVLKGGITFAVISADDKVKLSRIIELLRAG